MKLETLLAAIVAACPSVACQDMVGVDWTGEIYALDSFTGAAEQIGYGQFGQNCLARDAAGTLWSSAALIGGTAPPYFLSRVDPVSGTAVPMFPAHDMRGLAAGGGSDLYAVALEAGHNVLYRFNTATGSETRIGAAAVGGIQALAMHNGVLYGWDLNIGLGVLDRATGAFTDVNPAINGGPIQWLTERSDGQLIGGWFSLAVIDTATGVATPYALTTAMRGAERSPLAGRFGVGCNGGTGIVSLSVSGTLSPGGAVTLTSTGHTNNGPIFSPAGISVLGFSRTISQGAALPFSLDPIIGTVGCSIYVSVDTFLALPTIASSQVVVQHTFFLPAIYHDYTFFAQHFALDQVPGGISASNGVVIHVAD